MVAYKNGAPVHLSDVATVVEGAENTKLSSWANKTPAVLLNVQRQPGANVIAVVDPIKAMLPQIQGGLPASVDVRVLTDRTNTIRASVADVEFELDPGGRAGGAGDFRVPAQSARPPSFPACRCRSRIVGTFAAMYLLGYSLNNLSLMALTISAGFVVDDAIVMIENITRYLEQGDKPFEAAMKGAGEIGFTIVSLTISLIAVLIPLLFMQEVVGRLFREFAVTLAITILISAVVSLTLVPMLCAKLLQSHDVEANAAERFRRRTEEYSSASSRRYDRLLIWVLRHQPAHHDGGGRHAGVHRVALYPDPQGLFPAAGHRFDPGHHHRRSHVSFDEMARRQQALAAEDSAGQGCREPVLLHRRGRHQRHAQLRPLSDQSQAQGRPRQRHARWWPAAAGRHAVPGITFYLQPVQDLTIDSVVSRAEYQFVLQAATTSSLNDFVPKLLTQLARRPALANVSTDFMDKGLSALLVVDRDTAARFGITSATIDNALYDVFGQRIISTIFTQSNQYRVILEADPKLQNSVASMNDIYVPSAGGGQVPLSAIAHVDQRTVPLQIDHMGQFPSATISFDVAPGYSLGEAVDAVNAAENAAGHPSGITTQFEGSALAFQSALGNELLLIIAAIVTVYIVLGVLYESFIHPLTILRRFRPQASAPCCP